MNEYSHITQSLIISSLTSVYFAWQWFLKQSQKQKKDDNDRELLQNIKIIRLVKVFWYRNNIQKLKETIKIQKLLILAVR